MIRALLSVIFAALLTGCVSETVKSTSVPVLDAPATLTPEAELLDVGVVILDPGVSAVEDEEQVYPEVRKAEATFMATELAEVLTEQGGWGAVRVVPDDQQFSDLLVRGTILRSDGEALELKILVSDAQGTLWLDKRYQGVTSRYAYEQGTRVKQDPFLAVYRMIANDMLAIFNRLPSKARVAIRQVAELRFARDFANGAFADYLDEDDKGQISLRRLPAEDDPMLNRVRGLRQRHYVFVDTLRRQTGPAQNNAGVCVTQLAQNPRYRQQVRDLKGLESLVLKYRLEEGLTVRKLLEQNGLEKVEFLYIH